MVRHLNTTQCFTKPTHHASVTQATLKRHRIEYDHQHQPIAKNNMQHLKLQSQPTVTMQQLHERRQAAWECYRLEHAHQLQRSESRTVKTDDQAEDEVDHSC